MLPKTLGVNVVAGVLLPIVAEIAVDAPIDRTYQVLTNETASWLGCLNYQPAEGATFHMQPDSVRRAAGDITGATHCQIVTIKPPHKFDFTWFVPGTPETFVQISVFSEGPNRSFVRLMHDGWHQFAAADVQPFHAQLTQAWSEFVLPALKRAVETPA